MEILPKVAFPSVAGPAESVFDDVGGETRPREEHASRDSQAVSADISDPEAIEVARVLIDRLCCVTEKGREGRVADER